MIFLKPIITLVLIILTFYFIGVKAESIEIPDESIRLRVIANSNSEYDQNIKKQVVLSIQQELSNILKEETTIESSRKRINSNLYLINDSIEDIFKQNNYSLSFNVNYGLNYFPKKEFKGVMYNEGYYESLLITIGEGKGNNWWCVLFPPLCILEAEESEKVEYTSLIKEVLNKYL